MTKKIAQITLILLISLSPPLGTHNSYSLAPSSVLQEQQQATSTDLCFQPFEKSLEDALRKNGLFEQTFGEPVEHVGTEEPGDLHAYFNIDIDLSRIGFFFTSVKVHYLEKDNNGYGRQKCKQFFFWGNHRSKRKKQRIFGKIDEFAIDLVRKPTTEKKMFHNQTRIVQLKGKDTGKEYKIIYKFGASVDMEILSQFIIPNKEVFKARVLSSGQPYAIWTQYIDSIELSQYITENTEDKIKRLTLEVNEETKRIFHAIGKIMVWSFLLSARSQIIWNRNSQII